MFIYCSAVYSSHVDGIGFKCDSPCVAWGCMLCQYPQYTISLMLRCVFRLTTQRSGLEWYKNQPWHYAQTSPCMWS